MGEYDVYSDGLDGTVFTPFFRVPRGSNLSLLSVKNNTILELKKFIQGRKLIKRSLNCN